MSGFEFRTASQAELQRALDGMTKDGARKSGHQIEGLPVVFNPTAPAGRILVIGRGELNLTGGDEIHCTRESYRSFCEREDVRAAVVRMVTVIKEGLRRKRAREIAHTN